MLKAWWKIFWSMVLAVGVLLSFLVLIEVLRAYQTLHELHPAVGFVFLGVLLCGTVWIVGYLGVTLASRPAVLAPPAITDPNKPTNRELRRYGKYLTKYIRRLSENVDLSIEDRDKAKEDMLELALALKTGDNKEALFIAVEKAEEQVIKPMLAKLDEEANREIRSCVRDVMMGVIVSPYKAADLIIVLYRNLVMVARIVRIYNSRPRFRQQLRILWDTIKVVATVNYLNIGKSFLEALGSRVPLIGKFVDDIAQGIGAGFMTSVAGHAAMGRCRAFKGWSEEEAKNSLRNRANSFFADVRHIFVKDIKPEIKKRLGDVSKETWQKVETALDETGSRIGSFVKVPLITAGKAGTSGGRSVIRVVVEGGRKGKNMGLGILRGVKSAGGRILTYPGKKTRTIGKRIRRKKRREN